MKHLIFTSFLLLVVQSKTWAGDNLPNITGQKKVGRIVLFTSPKQVNWYLPMALSVDLSCSPNTSPHRSCILKVINSLSESESNELNNYQRNTKSTVTYFSTIQSHIVKQVEENFAGLPLVANILPSVSRTLEFNNRAPYARVDFRDTAEAISELETKYLSDGLGVFESKINLYTENIGDYLRVIDIRRLHSALQSTPAEGLTREELHTFLDALVSDAQYKLNNLKTEEAKALLKNYLRYKLFKLNVGTKYVLDHAGLRELGNEATFIDETYSPVNFTCNVKIELKEGAKQQVSCN